MRRNALVLAPLLILLGWATPAAATSTPFTGTLSMALTGGSTRYPLVSLTASGTADVTRSGGSLSAIALPASLFSAHVTIPITDPAASPITQMIVDVTSGSGLFDTIPGADIDNDFNTDLTGQGSGAMALSGQLDVGLFQGPLAHLIVPFTSAGVDGIGLGGGFVVATSSGISVSVRGAPWTTGTVSAAGVPLTGFVSDDTVQLVSQAVVSTSINADAPLRILSLLTLSFVPEPGTLLLLSGGLAALGMSARPLRSR